MKRESADGAAMNPTVRELLGHMVPRVVKDPMRRALQGRRFRRALGQLLRAKNQPPDTAILETLRAAWGNEGFSADIPLLAEVAKRALAVGGPVLECGSGLTTIILGLLVGRRGIPVHTLEHDPQWFEHVCSELRRYDVSGVVPHLARLTSYGPFEWYELPAGDWPAEFKLVVCDGPPNETTRGGRYGLLPLVGSRLGRGAQILLDDATYAPGIAVRQRWQGERRMREQIYEGRLGRDYAVLTLEES